MFCPSSYSKRKWKENYLKRERKRGGSCKTLGKTCSIIWSYGMPDTHTIAHPIRHPRRRMSACLPNGRSSAARTTHSPPPHHLRTSRSLAEPDGLLHPDKSLVTKSRGKSLAASCRRTSRKVCKSRRMSFWHHTHSPSSRHRRMFGSLAELDGPWHSRQSHGQILVPRCRCAVAEGLQVLANSLWQHARQLRVISQSLKVLEFRR